MLRDILLIVICSSVTYIVSGDKVCRKFRCYELASNLMFHMDGSVDPCQDFDQFACGGYRKRAYYKPEKNARFRLSIQDSETQLDMLMFDRLSREEDEIPEAYRKSAWKMKLMHYYKSCVRTLRKQKPFQVFYSLWNYFNSNNQSQSMYDIVAKAQSIGFPMLLNISYSLKESNVVIQTNLFTTENVSLYKRCDMDRLLKVLGPVFGESKENIPILSKKLTRLSSIILDFENNGPHNTHSSQSESFDYIFDRFAKNLLVAYSKEMGIPMFSTRSRINQLISQLKDFKHIITKLISLYDKDSSLFKKWLFVNYVGCNRKSHDLLSKSEMSDLGHKNVRSDVPIWKKCLTVVTASLAPAVIALVADESLGATGKQKLKSLMRSIKDAFMERVHEVKWLSPSGAKLAAVKIDSMSATIAYQDIVGQGCTFDDLLSNWEVSDTTDFYSNDLYLNRIMHKNMLKGLMARREEFLQLLPLLKSNFITYLTTNAHYHFKTNHICMLMGMTQPPRFHPKYPLYAQYGGAGSIIGHEIVHGFDSKNGPEIFQNSTADSEAFKNRTDCLDQYYRTNFRLPYVKNQTDRCTLGDDIADLGGLNLALAAYRNWKTLNNVGKDEPPLPGFERYTNEQMLYLTFAQPFCQKANVAGYRKLVKGVRCPYGHSLGMHRILGSLQNSVDFALAYKCPINSKMNPSHKCDIW